MIEVNVWAQTCHRDVSCLWPVSWAEEMFRDLSEFQCHCPKLFKKNRINHHEWKFPTNVFLESQAFFFLCNSLLHHYSWHFLKITHFWVIFCYGTGVIFSGKKNSGSLWWDADIFSPFSLLEVKCERSSLLESFIAAQEWWLHGSGHRACYLSAAGWDFVGMLLALNSSRPDLQPWRRNWWGKVQKIWQHHVLL